MPREAAREGLRQARGLDGAGAARRRYPRQEQEWELIEMVLGLRLPRDFEVLADRCRELWVEDLEVHVPRLEEVSFPVGSPARLNLRTRLEQVVREDADTGERWVFAMAPGRFEFVPWGSHPSGAVGYWYAVGDPDDWPVVVSYRGFLWREEGFLVGYLLRVLEGGARMPWLVEDTA